MIFRTGIILNKQNYISNLEIVLRNSGFENPEIESRYLAASLDGACLYYMFNTSSLDTKLFDTDHAKDRDYFQILAGLDYTIGIGNGLYMMGEYLYNGDGKKDAGDYTVEDWMEYFLGENFSLGEHSIFAGINYSPTELSNCAVYFITKIRSIYKYL